MPAEAGIASQRAGLQSLIDEEESRPEALGFTGDNMLAEPHRRDKYAADTPIIGDEHRHGRAVIDAYPIDRCFYIRADMCRSFASAYAFLHHDLKLIYEKL